MLQKAVRSEASSPNSLGPKRDWTEVRGEVHRPRTVLSWRSSSGGRRRAPTATGRLRPGPGGSGGWCILNGNTNIFFLPLGTAFGALKAHKHGFR